MQDVFLKPAEAAAYIGSSVSTLAKLRIYGGGPTYHKVGRSVRYSRAALDVFMAQRLVHSTSDATESKGGVRE